MSDRPDQLGLMKNAAASAVKAASQMSAYAEGLENLRAAGITPPDVQHPKWVRGEAQELLREHNALENLIAKHTKEK
ncbi:hypothetical protein OS125_11485 [Corynebacterium sp. P7003]|uniref:Uncharacterized protein n=1 Tax=Corynebacterium pygosceleis TaxID=2800406 RepID=A0ABT3WVR5_9CORY|nr:hypothetical protein [Corynebacterium pygosceleis]MCX7445853.1 hypothetical protein [Corynebacterium pygosceleis]